MISGSVERHLDKGYYPVKVQLTVAAGQKPVLTLQKRRSLGLGTDVKAGDFNSLPPFRALKASYYRDGLWDREKPFAVQWEPILDFADGNEFPSGAVYAIHWTGILNIPETGDYHFFAQTRASAGLKIDGKNLFEVGRNLQGNGYLRAGVHSIDVYCVNPGLGFPGFAFYWTRPDGTTEVVPNSSFGVVP